MAISEKKKISNARWDKENMTSLACRVRKDFAEEFKAMCAAAGTTSNAVLKQAAEDFIREHEIPNAQTRAAIEELDNGGGELFTGSTEELFKKILSEPDEEEDA